MKFYHVTTIENAKNIKKEGASSKKSEQQEGGFYLWTNLNIAKKYTEDPWITSKGADPCILVFELDFNTKDFDIDYELSAGPISIWVNSNRDNITNSIAKKFGTGGKYITRPTFVHKEEDKEPSDEVNFYGETRPTWRLPPTEKHPRGEIFIHQIQKQIK